jgi:hypothetical protein
MDPVELVRWPAGAARRADLADAGVPRLLVVDPDDPPPRCTDPLEDWVREPVGRSELDARRSTLARRAAAIAGQPRIDATGTVRVGRRGVELTAAQVAVARLLVSGFGRVVPGAQIEQACRAAGASDHPKAVAALMGRIKCRVAEVGLTVACVRDRGYVLSAEFDLSEQGPVDAPADVQG